MAKRAAKFDPIPAGWVSIGGKTFPVKDQLKSLGARWDGASWWVEPTKISQAQYTISGPPAPAPESFLLPKGSLAGGLSVEFHRDFPDAKSLPGKMPRVVGEGAEARVRAWFAERGVAL